MKKAFNSVIGLLFFIIIPALAYSQNDCITYEGKEINCTDSAGNRIGLWIEFDINHEKFSEVIYSAGGIAVEKRYFRLNGEELREYSTSAQLNQKTIDFFKEEVKNAFNWRNVVPRDGKGIVVVSFIIQRDGKISDVRLLRGIHQSFNIEVLRCIQLLEGKIVVLGSEECTKPVLIILPINFGT